MDWLIAFILLGILAYLVMTHFFPYGPNGRPAPVSKRRLMDYAIPGSVFENLDTALARGTRLIELHVFADEQGHPVVASGPVNDGRDFTEDSITFEQACVTLVNGAFPSEYPLILSIVPRTENSVTLNRVGEHLQTILRKTLIDTPNRNAAEMLMSELKGKTVIVSGGNIQGTILDELVNLSWSESHLRRLNPQDAAIPRDEDELEQFNAEEGITMVAPDAMFGLDKHPDSKKIAEHKCQWNLFERGAGVRALR